MQKMENLETSAQRELQGQSPSTWKAPNFVATKFGFIVGFATSLEYLLVGIKFIEEKRAKELIPQ